MAASVPNTSIDKSNSGFMAKNSLEQMGCSDSTNFSLIELDQSLKGSEQSLKVEQPQTAPTRLQTRLEEPLMSTFQADYGLQSDFSLTELEQSITEVCFFHLLCI